MSNLFRSAKTLLTVLAFGLALMVSAATAFALDRLTLKDGRVLTGELVRQDSSFVYFKAEGKKEAEIFSMDEVSKLEKDVDTKAPAKPAEAPKAAEPKKEEAEAEPKKDEPKAAENKDKSKGPALTGKPARVAILNFGMPQQRRQELRFDIDDTVGIQIAAGVWEEAMKYLDEDKIDTVIVRINSGGGALSEMGKFHEVFRKYKAKYRTVAWVESAISCAAMSPWVLNEFYMLPEGSIGACTAWHGNLQAMQGPGLIALIEQMKDVSREAGRDPLIMQAMQVMQPLSASVDQDGNVTWYADDTSGDMKVNGKGKILTFNAIDATRTKFAKGIAATKEDLVKVMGLQEVTWAGEKASKFIDDNMVKSHQTVKRFIEVVERYFRAREAARQLMNENPPDRKNTELGKARQALNEMRKQVEINPNFPDILGGQVNAELTKDWFEEQEKILREIAAGGQRGNGNGRGPNRMR